MALKDGVHQAKPALLEPIMAVEIRVPEAYMGEVNRDLNGRRGRVLGMDTDGRHAGHHGPRARRPSCSRYATELRSLTHGRGHVHATLDHYEDVPAHIAEKVIADAPQGTPRRPAATAAATDAPVGLRPARAVARRSRRPS